MVWTILVTVAFAQDQSLLFMGNSYIGVNQLDILVAEHLQEGAPGWDDVERARLANGGWTFSQHASALLSGPNGHTESLIDGDTEYDFVILQEQSQTSGFDQSGGTWQASLAAAEDLNAAIKDHGADTIFYMTWGRRNGDTDNPDRYPDFLTMQGHTTSGYMAYADALSKPKRPVFIAPAGPAFQAVYEAADDPADPQGLFVNLYNNDGSHPSPIGSMLVARVFYATITGRSPIGLTYNPAEIDADALAEISEIAHQVVLDEPFQEMRFPFALSWAEFADEETEVVIGGGAVRYQIRVEEPAGPASLTLNEGVLWLQSELQVSSFDADSSLSEIVFDGGALVVTSETSTHIDVASMSGAGTLEFTGLSSWTEADFPATVFTATDLDADLDLVVPDGFQATVDGTSVVIIWDGTTGVTGDDPTDAEGDAAADAGGGGCGCSQGGDSIGWLWVFGLFVAMRRRR